MAHTNASNITTSSSPQVREALPFQSGSGVPSHLPIAEQTATRRILILCGDADGNIGDRAIVQAMCQVLRQANPAVKPELAVVCANRERARRAYGAAALPPGWRSWPALWRMARASDLVICGGGGLFQDDDSLVKMPYWALRVAVARQRCSRVAGVALGVGPLEAGISRLSGRAALRRLDPVSVRDPLALRLASELAGKHVELVPDPALLLEPAPANEAEALLRFHGVPLDGRPLIGVAPRRWFPPKPRIIPHSLAWRWRGNRASYRDTNHTFAALLAQALDQVIDRCGGHVVFLPSYNRPHEADDRLCQGIAQQMRCPRYTLLRLNEPAIYKAVTGKLSVMLGGRMHPTIFAAASGTPIVGLAYNPKFHGLFDLLQLKDRVINVVDFVQGRHTDQLVALLETAMRGEPELADRAAVLAQQARDFLQRLVRTPA